jgi:hypothetical protein
LLKSSYIRIYAVSALVIILTYPHISSSEDKQDKPLKIGAGVSWSRLFKQSGLFLAFQCGTRIAYEPETRTELKGPFFGDWFESVRGLHGWGDGDPFAVNYLGHPWMGATAGRLFVQNDPSGRSLDFRNDKLYWKSRLKAFGWSALYSTNFELGIASEAAMGNIGGKPWPDGMTYTDLVVTPVLGTGLLITEDLADRYVIRWLERRTASIPLLGFTRTILNPARSMANVLRFKWPWYRDSRPGLRKVSWTQQSTPGSHKERSGK